MTLTPTAPDVVRAQELERDIVRGCQAIRSAWVDLAAKLYELQRDELWEPLGYESFKAFLARPGIELSAGHVTHLIQLYRELVVERGVAPGAIARVDMMKLRFVLPAVLADEVPVEDALNDCQELSRDAIAERYQRGRGNRGGLRADEWLCPTCGAKRRKAPT